MAETIATLLKVMGWRLDLQQRRLAGAERQVADLYRQDGELREEVEREGTTAAAVAPGPDNTYPAYVREALRRAQRLRAAAADAEADVVRQQADLRQTFGEHKRLEVLAERRRQQERSDEARRDQAALDEVALLRYVRSAGEV